MGKKSEDQDHKVETWDRRGRKASEQWTTADEASKAENRTFDDNSDIYITRVTRR